MLSRCSTGEEQRLGEEKDALLDSALRRPAELSSLVSMMLIVSISHPSSLTHSQSILPLSRCGQPPPLN